MFWSRRYELRHGNELTLNGFWLTINGFRSTINGFWLTINGLRNELTINGIWNELTSNGYATLWGKSYGYATLWCKSYGNARIRNESNGHARVRIEFATLWNESSRISSIVIKICKLNYKIYFNLIIKIFFKIFKIYLHNNYY